MKILFVKLMNIQIIFYDIYDKINKCNIFIIYHVSQVGTLERWCVCRGDQPLIINVVVKVGGTNT